MPAPPADRIASARQPRRSRSKAAASSPSETSTPSPTRISGVTHPRLAASTNSRATPRAVAIPPAQARVRAANACSASFDQLTGSRCGRGATGGRGGRERRRRASRRHGSGRGRLAARDDVRARRRRRRRRGTRRRQRLDRLLELIDALRQAADLGRQRNDLCAGDVVVSAHGIPSVVSAVRRHESTARAGGQVDVCRWYVMHRACGPGGSTASGRSLDIGDARTPSLAT